MMHENDIVSFFYKMLNSRTVDALRASGDKKGSGFYIRFYILMWMQANADHIGSIDDVARLSGCTRARSQVQAVWECLQKRGLLVHTPDGGASLSPLLTALARVASDSAHDEIAAGLHLSPDEIQDLQSRLGDAYMLCYHKAAEYKAGLIRKGREVKLADYSLVLKARAWIHDQGSIEDEDSMDDGILYLDEAT